MTELGVWSSYLREGGTLALRLDGDGVGSPLQDLVDVLLAELGAFILLIHQRSVRPLPQKVLDLLLGQLLNAAVCVLPAAHALQHGLVQAQLQAGLVKHLPLVAVPGDQPVDLHRLGLADAVASSLGLDDKKTVRRASSG